jgi:high-affinity K+ transport system ATPase subunit B
MENMEFPKVILAEMNAKMDTTQENTKANQEMEEYKSNARESGLKSKGIKEDIKTYQDKLEADSKNDRDEMKHEIRASQEHIKEIMERQFASLAAKLDGWRKEMQDDRESEQDHGFQNKS